MQTEELVQIWLTPDLTDANSLPEHVGDLTITLELHDPDAHHPFVLEVLEAQARMVAAELEHANSPHSSIQFVWMKEAP